jgi:hypothetical protein
VIQERHEHLREAGVAAFGLKPLDLYVPALGARVAGATSAPAQPGPAVEPPATPG